MCVRTGFRLVRESRKQIYTFVALPAQAEECKLLHKYNLSLVPSLLGCLGSGTDFLLSVSVLVLQEETGFG